MNPTTPSRPLLLGGVLLVVVAGSAALAGPAGATHYEPWAGVNTGTVEDAVTAEPVPGVSVSFHEIVVDSAVPDWGPVVTDAAGVWESPYIDFDEIAVHLDGSAVGYESGWLGWSVDASGVPVLDVYGDLDDAPSHSHTADSSLQAEPTVVALEPLAAADPGPGNSGGAGGSGDVPDAAAGAGRPDDTPGARPDLPPGRP